MISRPQYVQVGNLGKGTYGQVVEVTSPEGQNYALKIIPSNASGTTCLLEAVIMSSLNHPYLNHAEEVFSNSSHTYILSPKATADMSARNSYLNSHIFRTNINEARIASWLFMIATAVQTLHSISIIHGDIKPKNVLYYAEDDTLKLTDFTLSVKSWPGRDQFRKSACTYSYSPPEYLQGKDWDKSLDIWSLACTFYEIAFGSILFPTQTPHSNKYVTKMAYYNAIIMWFRSLKHNYDYISGYEFTPAAPVASFRYPETPSDIALRKLLLAMLQFDPSQRINIEEVLNSDYFQYWTSVNNLSATQVTVYYFDYQLLDSTKSKEIYDQVVAYLSEPIQSLEFNKANISISCLKFIYQVALHTLSACRELHSFFPWNLMVIASISLASKVVLNRPVDLVTSSSNQISLDKIVRMENKICAHLRYCLPIFFDLTSEVK